MTLLRRNEGFTLIELLIVVAIIGIIAAIAVPGLLRARIAANEASAIGSLRTIVTSQTAYAAVCGSGSFATSLPTLAVPPAGSVVPFLPSELTLGVTVPKSGFWVTLNAAGFAAGTVDCNGTPTAVGYYASATPMGPTTGNRGFATSHENSIFFAFGAPPAPPGSGTPIQ